MAVFGDRRKLSVDCLQVRQLGFHRVSGVDQIAQLDDTIDPGLFELNRSLSVSWPNITRKGEAPADAEEFREEKDKFEKYFSDKPAAR